MAESQLHSEKSNSIWLKSASIAGIWAGFEFVLGSYLHNLRLPFAGTIMSTVAVALITALHRQWPLKGVIWRAGLICAVMKSASPSSVIIGPMLGIFLQGLFMELGIRVAGCNLIGYSIGGALALSASLTQKILRLLIVYGADMVDTVSTAYRFAVIQTGITTSSPLQALGFLFIAYALLGSTGALAGILIAGKRSDTSVCRPQKNKEELPTAEKQTKYFHFNSLLIIVNMIALPAGLFVLSLETFAISSVLIIPLLTLLIIRYGEQTPFLKTKIFWEQIIFASLLVSIFCLFSLQESDFYASCIITGTRTGLRAAFVLVVFSAISVELKNPILVSGFYMKNFPTVYNATKLAFSSLPAVISELSGGRNSSVGGLVKIRNMVRQSTQLYQHFLNETAKPRLLILTGQVDSGKTTFLEKIIQQLKNNKIQVRGIISEKDEHSLTCIDHTSAAETFHSAAIEGQNRFARSHSVPTRHRPDKPVLARTDDTLNRFGSKKCDQCGLTDTSYRLRSVMDKKSIMLCSTKPETGRQKYGRFFFNPEALEFGKKILDEIDKGIVVIDEVGGFELQGNGWAKSLLKLSLNKNVTVITVVRKKLISEVLAALGNPPHLIFNTENKNIKAITSYLI